jgi:hypothetical protein
MASRVARAVKENAGHDPVGGPKSRYPHIPNPNKALAVNDEPHPISSIFSNSGDDLGSYTASFPARNSHDDRTYPGPSSMNYGTE